MRYNTIVEPPHFDAAGPHGNGKQRCPAKWTRFGRTTYSERPLHATASCTALLLYNICECFARRRQAEAAVPAGSQQPPLRNTRHVDGFTCRLLLFPVRCRSPRHWKGIRGMFGQSRRAAKGLSAPFRIKTGSQPPQKRLRSCFLLSGAGFSGLRWSWQSTCRSGCIRGCCCRSQGRIRLFPPRGRASFWRGQRSPRRSSG